MGEILVEKKINVLENKVVILKPIVRERPFFKKGHDGEFMFTGCKERFTLPYDNKTMAYVKIFEKGEQEEFERLLQKKPGELTIYDRSNKFWTKFWVELDKDDKKLDLNNPVHALQLRIIKANKDYVAPSWEERNNRNSYKWAIIDEKTVFEEDNKKADNMLNAASLFASIKNSQTQMRNVLRLMNRKVDKDANKDFLQREIAKILSQTEKINGIANITDFITAAEDPLLNEKIFVFDAIDAKLISVIGGEFRDIETGRLLGQSLQSVVDHFSDPSYQEDKILIQEKIKRSN